MAFGHLLRSAVAGFQRISVQNLILIAQMVFKKFEHYVKMGHISANRFIYTIYRVGPERT